ncbi:MAG: flagellar protein FliT [Gammaproteobacteria bacterium]|nr:MAG: flagellar protein FliT [Gammaproteobacteria bacterium]
MHGLDQILLLTEAVEQHVERGEWAEAGALDDERRRLLAGLCGDGAPASGLPACRELLRELLSRNDQTIQRVQAERQRLQADAARSGKAMRAYDRNAAGTSVSRLRTVEVKQP